LNNLRGLEFLLAGARPPAPSSSTHWVRHQARPRLPRVRPRVAQPRAKRPGGRVIRAFHHPRLPASLAVALAAPGPLLRTRRCMRAPRGPAAAPVRARAWRSAVALGHVAGFPGGETHHPRVVGGCARRVGARHPPAPHRSTRPPECRCRAAVGTAVTASGPHSAPSAARGLAHANRGISRSTPLVSPPCVKTRGCARLRAPNRNVAAYRSPPLRSPSTSGALKGWGRATGIRPRTGRLLLHLAFAPRLHSCDTDVRGQGFRLSLNRDTMSTCNDVLLAYVCGSLSPTNNTVNECRSGRIELTVYP